MKGKKKMRGQIQSVFSRETEGLGNLTWKWKTEEKSRFFPQIWAWALGYMVGWLVKRGSNAGPYTRDEQIWQCVRIPIPPDGWSLKWIELGVNMPTKATATVPNSHVFCSNSRSRLDACFSLLVWSTDMFLRQRALYLSQCLGVFCWRKMT